MTHFSHQVETESSLSGPIPQHTPSSMDRADTRLFSGKQPVQATDEVRCILRDRALGKQRLAKQH